MMLIAWFPILAIPVVASYKDIKSKKEDGEGSTGSSPDPELYYQSIDGNNADAPPLNSDRLGRDLEIYPSRLMYTIEDIPDKLLITRNDPSQELWDESPFRRRKREALSPQDEWNILFDRLKPEKRNPEISFDPQETPDFENWSEKQTEALAKSLEHRPPQSKREAMKFANAPTPGNNGYKRRPAFNSWGGKRASPGMAFNSWGGKRAPAGPAFNSWGGKRSKPAFNSWGGKRGPAFNSWGGKRGPAFNSWGGKRGPAFNSWGGKRGPAFNSWGGKRGPAFNSWGGKRGPAFSSWGGKRANPKTIWEDEEPEFQIWGGDHKETFSAERNPGVDLFRSDGSNFNLDNLALKAMAEGGAGDAIVLRKRGIPPDESSQQSLNERNFSTSSQDKSTQNNELIHNHSLTKREISSDTLDIDVEKLFHNLEAASVPISKVELSEIVKSFQDMQRNKYVEKKSAMSRENIGYLLKIILKLSEKEPEEKKKSIFHKMLVRASNSGYQVGQSTFKHARRGAEFHSWGGKRNDIQN